MRAWRDSNFSLPPLTVGDFLNELRGHWSGKPKTRPAAAALVVRGVPDVGLESIKFSFDRQ